MKQLVLLLATLATFSFGWGQHYNFLGEYTADGTPKYFDGKDEVSQETLQLIADALPEGFPVPDYNPQYITSGYDTDVVLEEAADVWVTFVGEGAGYKNVLGFYTYDIDNPLTETPQPEDITIVFPNVSALYSGGSLEVGHRVKIGRFEAGTGIGWVLLANGWKGSVTPGLWQLFSNTDFNPEADKNLRYHNVLLNDPDNERIILGFEDIRRDYGSCDNDFNDALFYITANPFTAIKSTNYNKITDHAPVSSGNDGGLESNGDLARLIAKRNFDRNKTNSFKNKQSLQYKYNKKAYRLRGAKSGSLDGYFPTTGMFGDETPYISSPEDLLGITNAEKVFSIDYYQDGERVSAALATETYGKVYNHTKTICDRLNDSQLLDVRMVTLQGHQLVYSELRRANGNIEYALVFSVKEEGVSRTVYSRWNLEEYPAGDYKNFQIWGNSMGQVSTIANTILNALAKEQELKSNTAANVLPKVFIKNGYYSNGKLQLNLVNKVGARWMLLDANYKITEQQEEQNLNQVVDLSGNWDETVTIDTGHLFDMGLSIIAEGSYQHDAMYVAEGPWGVDMNTAVDAVAEFTVMPHKAAPIDGHTIARGVVAQGKVKETINVFRNVLAGDLQLPVLTYHYLHFNIKNDRPIEISLVTDATADWNGRLRLTLPANEVQTEHVLAFSDFKNQEGRSVDFTQLRTIVFSIQGDYENYTPFSLAVDALALTKNGKRAQAEEASERFENGEELSIDGMESQTSEAVAVPLALVNYPNPFTEYTIITLPELTDSVGVTVTHLGGQTLYHKQLETQSNNSIRLDLGNLPSGIYAYRLVDMRNGKTYSGKLIKE